MIKTNEYYYTVYGRMDNLKNAIRAFFYDISSFPRLLIEVFLRHDMGRDYFSLDHCIRFGLFLAVLPFLLPPSYSQTWHHVLISNWGWYLFLVAFGKFSWDRHKECRKPHGYFDFNHFSKSPGKRLPRLELLKFQGKLINVRSLDVYVEPLIATAAGLAALLLGQWLLALLLMLCGGIYSMSYKATYELGRRSIQEKINLRILNGWFNETFLKDKPNPTNFQYFIVKPTTDEVRDGFKKLFQNDDDGVDVE